eukprot:5942614-Pyramimonas_sp.AAC.2
MHAVCAGSGSLRWTSPGVDGKKLAFNFNSTVDSRRLSTLVYHSTHGISNILSNIRRIFPADRLPLADSRLRGLMVDSARRGHVVPWLNKGVMSVMSSEPSANNWGENRILQWCSGLIRA